MSTCDFIEQHLLQTLVPVNVLTNDHLQALLRDQSIEIVYKGQRLFDRGDCDNNHIYLLSGSVELSSFTSSDNESTIIVSADDPDSRFPLAHHQPRRCQALAVSDCRVIRFDSDQLDSMLAWDQASQYIMLDISAQRDLDEDADWMLTLLKSNLFYKVPPMNIRQILNKFEPLCIASGETILRQGEVGDACYFIKEGEVEVYQAVDAKSPSNLVATLGVGRCFGEDALVNDAMRNATVVMRDNGVLMRLDKKDFFLLLKHADVAKVNFNEARQQIKEGACWVDVRSQDEFDRGHCSDALHMPLNLLKLKSRMLDKSRHYIVYCNSGCRSEAAVRLLTEDGYSVSVLGGGFIDYPELEPIFLGVDEPKQVCYR